ncbi:Sterol O-acyltransferase 1, variant 2 [Dermatophagoides farinae]|uniref:O-acyltransferase n=1 Tax=Dermatophagoides farinae TaxID=6954 RepID=A0A922HRQ9_DERFA|nr:Sterol O-acyltransferase 1, variant 2 [Dermatophagoides farinae]
MDNNIANGENGKTNATTTRRRMIPETGKIIKFQHRESLLTQMLNNSSHIRTLHNLITGFVTIFLVATIADYIKQPSKFRDEYETFLWNIADFGRFIQIWLIMNLSVICLHYPLVLLNNFYQYRWLINNPEKDLDRLFEMYQKQKYSGWLQQTFLYIAYALISFFGIFFYCTNRLIVLDIKITGSFAALMEMTRLLMKSHSFFIEKKDLQIEKEELVKLIAQKRQKHIIQSFWSSSSRARFRNLIYYLFSPTLIYSDHYPRTEKIRWSRVLNFGIQFIVACLISFLILFRFVVATFSKTGIEPFPLNFNFIYKMLACGLAIYLLCFHGFLHTWHNFTAELIRFADRHYYDDHWNTTKLKDYYRKWNLIVQHWLYVYIFLPIHLRFHNRNLSNFSVILVSAIMHEYIINLSLRFFMPLNFLLFAVFAQMLYFYQKRNNGDDDKQDNWKNIIFQTSIFIGISLQILLYSLEWYSRINCPLQEQSTIIEKLSPRFIYCVKF